MKIVQAHAPAGGHLCYHKGRGHPLRMKLTENKTEQSDGKRGVCEEEKKGGVCPNGRAPPVMT